MAHSQLPVILLAFANDDGRSLRQLDEEQRDLRQIFEQVRREKICEIEVLPAVTATDIIRAFQTFRDRIRVFHYGGHSNEDKIFLKDHYQQEKGFKADNFAKFLALQNGLELIFLNSCLSLKQAEVYHKAGIKAVIATSREIGDQAAREFAELFYNSLTTGASISNAYEEADKGYQILFEESYRGFVLQSNHSKDQNPWKIFPNKSHSWRLPLTARYLTRIPSIDLDKEFIGREKELQKLKEKLEQTSKAVLVNGLGGIGKTVLVTAYVQTHNEDYDHLVWINCREDLIEAFSLNVELADVLGMPFQKDEDPNERFRRILWKLQQIPGHNLLVVDNPQELAGSKEVQENLPRPPHWHVVLTSRLELAGFDRMRLDTLNPDAAKALFRIYFRGPHTEAELEELLEEIGYHTLSVELLARLLDKLNNVMSLPELAAILRQKQLDDTDLQERVWVRYSGEEQGIFLHLMKAFELSPLGEQEKWLLKQFVVMPIERYAVAFLADFLQEKPLALNKVLNSLADKGWLSLHEDKTFSIHRLIRQVAEYQLHPVYTDVETLVGTINRKMSVDAYTNRIAATVPWISFATGVENYFVNIIHEQIAQLQNNIAATYRALGQYKVALSYLEKALEIRKKVLSANHPSLVTSLNNIAVIYRDLGQYRRALSYLKKAFKIRKQDFEEEQLQLASFYNNFGVTYRDLKQYKLALSYQHKALTIRELELEANHPDLAVSYNNIALVFSDLTQYDEALEYHQKALKIMELVLEKNHPSLAISYNNIAEIYRVQMLHEKALFFHQKALKIKKLILDINHPDLAISYNNIAITYNALGLFEEALDYHQTAISIRESMLEPTHPSLAISYDNIATVYSNQGNYDMARDYEEKAAAIWRNLNK